MTVSEINVLVGLADWAWPEAVRQIFAPRGVNSIVAADAAGALEIIGNNRIYAAIVDVDAVRPSGLSIIKVIHGYYPLLPCVVVSGSSQRASLASALEFEAFGVIAKPVDMGILQDELNRLFTKRYNSNIFGDIQRI